MHINVTDGRYVYMRAPENASNRPLLEHTLMPTHMRWQFTPEELKRAELMEGFSFTQGVPLLRMDGLPFGGGDAFELGTLLFDLETDPAQDRPLHDPALELRMIDLMLDLMRRNDAPLSQFERMGLPRHGPAGIEHTRLGRGEAAESDDGSAPVERRKEPSGK